MPPLSSPNALPRSLRQQLRSLVAQERRKGIARKVGLSEVSNIVSVE